MTINELVNRIIVWGKERELPEEFDFEREFLNIVEELFEIGSGYDSSISRHLATHIYGEWRRYLEKDIDINKEEVRERIINGVCDIIIYALQIPYKLGYDVEGVLIETLKEIESRKGYYDKDKKKFVKTNNSSYIAQYSKYKNK